MTETDQLLKAAKAALSSGNLIASLDYLRRAHALWPEDPEIIDLYAKLQQHQLLQERLREIQADYNARLATRSLVDAHDKALQGLLLLAESRSPLPTDARRILITIVKLGDTEGSLAGDEEWQIAQDLLTQLLCSASQDWWRWRACELASEWLNLRRDISRLGIISSARMLGNGREAYRLARSYLRDHPTDEDAIHLCAEITVEFLDRLNSSARKRLSRAKDAVEQGYLSIAVDNLNSLEDEFYRPVEAEFPGFLDDIEEVDSIRAQANQLKQEIEEYHSLYPEIRSQLQSAEIAFVEGRLDEAGRSVPKIPDTLPAFHLAEQAKTLRRLISQTRSRKHDVDVAHQANADSPEATEARQKERARLRHKLRECFNESELRDICFDLQIDYEELPGQEVKTKTIEVILYLERRGRLSELVNMCKQLRPDISW